MKSQIFFSVFILSILISLNVVDAQVSVAPPVVFMSPDSRFGLLMLENRTFNTQEVSVEFKFGYPTSDSLGVVAMQYVDSTAERQYSITSWLKAFPKKFVLTPGQQQSVRLALTAPLSLPDGIYWTRIITTGAPQQKFIDTVQKGITTQLNYVFQQVTTAAFVKGKIVSQLAIQGRGAQRDSSGITILWYVNRTGNAPYFGTAVTKIYNQRGDIVDETKESLAIYFSMMKRSFFSNTSFKAGSYSVEVSLLPERTDIPSDQLKLFGSFSQRFNVTIP
jgi:hypothetical protein